MHELRETLTNVAFQTGIPSEIIEKIIKMADKDQNGVLDFQEFMTLVRTRELALLYPKLNLIMRSAAFVVVPRSERQVVMRTYLEEYKCCPPPFMMPLLSLVEVIN